MFLKNYTLNIFIVLSEFLFEIINELLALNSFIRTRSIEMSLLNEAFMYALAINATQRHIRRHFRDYSVG